MNRYMQMILCCAILLMLDTPVLAGEVIIEQARFELRHGTWDVSTTLRHADTGWEHYADGWRVVTEAGEVLGTRTLFHPHVDEQPFTRSQSDIHIPEGTNIVYVEAHDTVHGWSKKRLRVDLQQSTGPGFSVNR